MPKVKITWTTTEEHTVYLGNELSEEWLEMSEEDQADALGEYEGDDTSMGGVDRIDIETEEVDDDE